MFAFKLYKLLVTLLLRSKMSKISKILTKLDFFYIKKNKKKQQ